MKTKVDFSFYIVFGDNKNKQTNMGLSLQLTARQEQSS
jgi:hypothetical protein